jgi:ribonuclease HIII
MNTFVATIDLALAPKLEEDLQSQGFVLTKPPYTLFSANKTGVSCTLYTSGKLTVQGKGKDEFITFYLEPEILKNISYSHPELDVDLTPRIGGDEAGKGDFFGPLCVAAVYASEEGIGQLLKLGVKDSKQMNDKAMLALAPKIRAVCTVSVVRISPLKYNEMYQNFKNLNHLLAWGHATAIAEVVEKTGCQTALIDQFTAEPLVANALAKKGIRINLTQRPRAEEDPVVAAASIMARAAFVDGIDMLGKEIGFTLPKGASSLVIDAGRKLVQKEGRGILERVAKLHFKTTQQILTVS